MRKNTIKNYRKIQNRFEDLYKVKRLRYDDTIKQLCDEYDKEYGSINRILNTTLPDLTVVDTSQGDLFAQ